MKNNPVFKKIIQILWPLLIWELAALIMGERVLFAGPVDVIRCFPGLLREGGFYSSVWFSFKRIAGGFFAGSFTAIILAVISGRYPHIETLVSPFLTVVKTVPVASFIIIALIWISSRGLSMFISFLMVLPVVYTACLSGIKSTDPGMLDMAKLYRLTFMKKLRYIWLPSMRVSVLASCKTALGLSFKAGIAAEVIGMPEGSIGERLYDAKVYLDTPALFAWTVVIVALSVIFEKAVVYLIKLFYRRLFKAV